MLARIRAAANKDEGFTLVELLIVMIIVAILAAIAIPVFLNQKAKAYDTKVKQDLSNFATQFETYATDADKYPTAATDIPNVTFSAGDKFHVYVVSTGSNPGYVIYGKNDNSDKVYALSTWAGGAVTASTLTTLPAGTTLPTEDTWLKAPTTATFVTFDLG